MSRTLLTTLAITLLGAPTASGQLLDRHGDPLPAGATARMGWTRLAHGGYVRSITFSSDGRSIFSTGVDDTLRAWDVGDGRALWTLDSGCGGECLSRGPNDRLALLSHNELLLVNGADGKLEKRRRVGHSATPMAWSPDGAWFAVSRYSKGVELLSAAGKPPIRLKTPSPLWPEVMRFSPDSKTIAVAHSKDVYVFSLSRPGAPAVLKGHTAGVEGVAFLPDGKVVSGGRDKTIRVWSWSPPKLLRTLKSPTRMAWGTEIYGVAASPDGKHVATGHGDGAVLWSTADWTPRHILKGSTTSALAFSPDSTRLATGSEDHFVRIWNVADGLDVHPRREWCRWMKDLRVDGDTFLIGCYDGSVRRHKLSDGAPIETVGHVMGRVRGDPIRRLAVLPGGAVVAAGDYDGIRVLRKGKPARRIGDQEDHEPGNVFVALPGGKRLVSAYMTDLVEWRVADGKELRRRETGHKDVIEAIEVGPKDGLIATGDEEGVVKLWSMGSLKPRGMLIHDKDKEDDIRALAFAPAGGTLASSCGDGWIRLWALPRGRQLRAWDPDCYGISDLAYSPAGDLLAAACGKNYVLLFDPATKAVRRRLNGHQASISGVAFSRDGKRLVSISRDWTALIWPMN